MYWANAVSVATRLQTVHTTRTRLFVTHVLTVTPITNTPTNTMGLFLGHVKTAPPRQSAIFGSIASDGVYQSTVDGIHQTPLSHMRRQSHRSMLCCTHSNDTHHFLLTQNLDSTSLNRVLESTKHQRKRTPRTLWCLKLVSTYHKYDRLRFIYNNTPHLAG